MVATEALLGIAHLAEGLSGRALRKLPFQAHAFYVQVSELSKRWNRLESNQSASRVHQPYLLRSTPNSSLNFSDLSTHGI